MSEKKRSRRRNKDEYTGPGGVPEEAEKPSKDEYAVAKWLKKNVRTKRTKFLSHNVEYFTATKALDALMSSKFSEGDNCLFSTRENAIEFLDTMLEHKFFHRAKKVPVYPEDLKGKSKKSSAISGTTTEKEKESISTTSIKKDATIKEDKDKEKAAISADGEGSHAEGNGSQVEEAKEKRKRKIKLDMHPEQVFVDGSEAYVWIYDPVPIHYWIYGMALVLGAIVVCLFPLWPPILRKGVYYLSIAAAGFLVFILILTIIRLIIFVIVWILTGGKLYFWIFPNLTEDVGFLASFWPLYESEYHVESGSSKSGKKSKKKKKDKDSDAEDEGGDQQPLLEPEKIENVKEHEETDSIDNENNDEYDEEDDEDNGNSDNKSKVDDNIEKDSEKQSKKDEKSTEGKENTTPTPSESESEGSRSSTGKDFEIVDAPDLEITPSPTAK